MTQLSVPEILNNIRHDSKLAERCRSQPSFRDDLIRSAESLLSYYTSLSAEAVSSFFAHLRHFQSDPDNYLSYYTELLFAELLLQKGVCHRFLQEGADPCPDIKVFHDDTVLYCEVASLQEDAILQAAMIVKDRISRISSGVAISLNIHTLDHDGQFENNLSLINEAEHIIDNSLRQEDYSPVARDGQLDIEFTRIDNNIPSELLFVRAAWEKTNWIESKLEKVINSKRRQLESKPDTILVWWNHDPRTMDFRKAIPNTLLQIQVSKILGILLVDPLLGNVIFTNPNMHNGSEKLTIFGRALNCSR